MAIRIKGLSMTVGSIVETNTKYVEYFRSKGQEVEGFLTNVLGLNERRVRDKGVTGLDLMKDAVDDVLKQTGCTGEDMDMIICCSTIPEYFSPTQALAIHRYIKGKDECVVFDMNANCIGLLAAIHNIRMMMKSSSIKKVLLIGCDIASPIVDYDNAAMYGHFGDCATATILESIEDSKSDILVDRVSTFTNIPCEIKIPSNGVVDLFSGPINPAKDNLAIWNNVGSQEAYTKAIEELGTLLERNNIRIEDIKLFAVSQVTASIPKTVRNKFGVSEEVCPYYGGKYGYTGCSSPLTVVYEAIQTGKLQRGDLIVLWTYGIGYTQAGIILRY